MVILEAMAHGLPIVCLDYGGPAGMVDSDCGTVVPIAETAEATVERLAEGLRRFARDPSARARAGAAARRAIEERCLWRSRHRVVERWYAMAMGETALHVGPAAASRPSVRGEYDARAEPRLRHEDQ